MLHAPRRRLIVLNPGYNVVVIAAIVAVEVSRADGAQLFAKAW
jgi:hypothetical protein